MVDLAYVIVGAFAAMIKIAGAGIVANSTGAPNGVNGLNTIGLFQQLVSGNGLWSILVSLTVLVILLLVIGAVLFFGGALSTVTVVGGLVGVPLLIGAVLILLFAVMILLTMFRLFWLMAKTACITVLLIVAGPLMLLIGNFSTSGGFGQWIKTLLANLAVYPTVIIMIFLSHYFFWGWFLGGASGVAPIFPYLNTFGINWTTTVPATVSLPGMPIGTNIIGVILAFVILFLTPKAADIIQSLISGKPFGLGSAIGEAVGPARGLTGYGVATGVGYGATQLTKPGAPLSGGVKQDVAGEVAKSIAGWASRGFK